MTGRNVLRGTACAAVGVLALLLSGCGDKKREAQAPDPALQRYARAEAPAYTPSPNDPRAGQYSPGGSGGRTIYTARSQADLNRIYSQTVAVQPVAPRAAQPVAQPVSAPAFDSGSVVADPDWDVPVSRDWRHIVVHHSASSTGSAAAFDKAHRDRGWDGLGYHFVIGNGTLSGDGEVEVGYRWKRQMQGAHAGNAEYNQAGIGICLVGDFQHGGRPSSAQMKSLYNLVRFLQVKCSVPTYEVIGHGNVPGKSTECPGQYLDLPSFRAALGSGAGGAVQVAQSGSAPKPATKSSSTRSATTSSRSTRSASTSSRGAAFP